MERINVLYLDDNDVDLHAARQELEASGFSVTTAKNVSEARPHLAASDIVLIDFHMMGLPGDVALRSLREDNDGKDPGPLYYLYTSDASAGSRYREMGFDGRVLLKGDPAALRKQMDAAGRIVQLRRRRPA